MSEIDPPALFVGDLEDGWVREIADALPRGTIRLDCRGDLPGDWPSDLSKVGLIVVHRPWLSMGDADSLRQLRILSEKERGRPLKVVVCLGPHARSPMAEKWAPVVDVFLPEATASETVARHLGEKIRRPGRRSTRVAVVSGLHDLRRTIVEMVGFAGYPVAASRDWPGARPAALAVWDVPVLEPNWPELLAEASNSRRVVALLGFADRETVALARSRGAAACLDMPCDPTDLAFVLDRLARVTVADPPHDVPPAPAGLMRKGFVGGRSARKALE